MENNQGKGVEEQHNDIVLDDLSEKDLLLVQDQQSGQQSPSKKQLTLQIEDPNNNLEQDQLEQQQLQSQDSKDAKDKQNQILQKKLFEEDQDDFDDLDLESLKITRKFSDPNIKLDLDDLDKLRNQYDKDFQVIYQQPNGHQILNDIENQLDQLDILSDDFKSQISLESIKTTSTDKLNATNVSVKPGQYIPQALKEKLDVLMLNFHKDLAVLSHQRVVLLWAAVRMYEPQHRKFWKVLKESYKSHLIMKRYCDYRRLSYDLEEKYKYNPIVLMISGYLGETVVPQIYNKYRFKGIVVFTDKRGIPFNTQWIKRFPRIVLLTDEEKQAQTMLNKLIHNTLFRGACKFKDLDHFLGKSQTVSSYFLKTKGDMQPYKKYRQDQINKDQKKKEQNIQVRKQLYGRPITSSRFEEAQQDLKDYIKVTDAFSLDREYEDREKLEEEKEEQEIKQNGKIEQNKKEFPSDELFILNNWEEGKQYKDRRYYLDTLFKCREIVKQKNVLIRMDMFEDKSLERIADLYADIVKQDSEKEFIKKVLHLYTKNETDFYAIVNCALNTLNENLIMCMQDFIKTIRFCHQQYDDEDLLFEEGNIVHLWRGCTFDKDHFQKFFKKGEHIVFPAFTSTSSDEKQALQYGKAGTEKRIIFKIECVCDEKLMKIRPKNLKQISAYPDESEYLMNCFSLLYIEDVQTDYMKDNDGAYLLYKLKLLQ